MSRKFITKKELAFIEKINKELIQNVIGQEVFYYSISKEHTVTHRLYNEATDKVWYAPVKINALVNYDNPTVETNNFTLDSKYEVEVYFHTDELDDRNIKPQDGEFIEFGQIVYEITSVTKPQIVFGQIQEKLMTKCVCVPSREGQFQIHGDSWQNIDNTTSIEDPECT